MRSVPPRQGVPPSRESDRGPIPEPMLDDLRRLLQRMERQPLYSSVGMGLVIGGVYLSGILFFALAIPTKHVDRVDVAIASASLSILAAMAYAPFLRWRFDSAFEAKCLREVLYSRQLEDLSEHMAVCRMGNHTKVADALLKIWLRNGVEPGWSARAPEPRPTFR